MTKKKKLITTGGVLILLLVALDINYFYGNIKYFLRGGTTVFETNPGQIKQTEPNWITIDSLGIKAPIVYVEQNNEKVFQEGLANGVVHYPGTAMPGESGNCYIFGHSSDLVWKKGNFKEVFATLPKIQIGEKIKVSNKEGKQFTYVVKESKKVSSDDVSVLKQDLSKKVLTLQTSYPVGTALARWIVVAEEK